MNRSAKCLACLATFAAALFLSTHRAMAQNVVYGQVQAFEWQEYFPDGSLLLEEDGILYGLGYRSDFFVAPDMSFVGRADVFVGEVDYDGQLIDGTPFRSKTDYAGVKLEGDIALHLRLAPDVDLKPFAGLGIKSWVRELGADSPANGYDEYWYTVYGRLGLSLDLQVHPGVTYFADAGIRIGIDNRNDSEIVKYEQGTLHLDPEEETTAFVELGMRYFNLYASILYEEWEFGQSPAEGNPAFLQPRSTSDGLLFTLGLIF